MVLLINNNFFYIFLILLKLSNALSPIMLFRQYILEPLLPDTRTTSYLYNKSQKNLTNNELNSGEILIDEQQQQQKPDGQFVALNDKEYVFVPAGQLLQVQEDNPYLEKYDGAQLWKLHSTELNGPIIRRIKKIGGRVWDMNQDGIDIFFENGKLASEAKQIIDNSDTTYNIMIENMQNAVEDTISIFNFTKDNVPWLISDELEMTWDQYHDFNVFNEFYHYVLDHFPSITQLLVIGRSHEKRDIKVLKISNGNPQNQAIFIDSGIQGREWIGPAAVTLSISKMLYNWKQNPEYMKNIDWYFLPIANPDGYEYSRNVDRLWTKNRRLNGVCEGVNIDRNFDYQWGKRGSVGDPCSQYYRGPERFSEPESIAIKNILSQLDESISAYISVGSYGQMITYPWGDDDFVPVNHKEMHRLGKLIIKNIRKSTRGEYQTGSSYSLKFARSGNSADWVLDSLNPDYVFNFYLRDQGRYGYVLPPSFIIQSGFEVYEMIRTIAEDLNMEKKLSNNTKKQRINKKRLLN